MSDIEDIYDDVMNWVDDWAGTEFGSEEQMEDYQNSLPPMPTPTPRRPTTASEVIAKRKEARDLRASKLAEEQSGDVGKVASYRTGTGGIRSGKGQEKARLRAQKFKKSRPLKIGVVRPK
jgi:hypothetical protein